MKFPKPKPKQKLSTITNKLDTVTSQIVRLRDKKCVVCGSFENLQCGHYISRVFVNTRWDLRNCNCQCASCNVSHELDSVPYTDFMIAKYGMQVVHELSTAAHSSKKMSRSERLLLLAQLDNQYKLMKLEET